MNRKVCARGSLGADPDSVFKIIQNCQKNKKCPLEYSFEYFIVPLVKLNNDQLCYHDKKKILKFPPPKSQGRMHPRTPAPRLQNKINRGGSIYILECLDSKYIDIVNVFVMHY